ncbi:hypothetical protein ACNSOL_12325 (plasmid) [Aliarcobacter lanthieri]|uniref:hypothetical protein n=1 Tax=Aliarcobacter lanthieri TaxID=1355374 RepID=UPI003AAD9266
MQTTNIKNSYPLKTLTLDCQKRMMRELMMDNKLITSSDFKQPYLEHFKYIPTGTSIEDGNVIDGQFAAYKENEFIRQMNDYDYQIKYPIVFEFEIDKEEIMFKTKQQQIEETIDIINVVIIDFSEEEVAEYIDRCIKYLNNRFGSKYVLEIWETDEVYGQRDDEDDYSEEYQGHSMYQGKIALFDGVFENDIKFTGTYCEISAVFSDLLSSLEIIEKETITKVS